MMRVMKEFFGILLLDQAEIILRVYQAGEHEWQLLHYFSRDLADTKAEAAIDAPDITQVILEFLSKNATQNISDWKVCSRGLSEAVVQEVANATGFTIERLVAHREQELLCKGLFTELW